MNSQSPTQNSSISIAGGMDVKEQKFLTAEENNGIAQKGIPIAGTYLFPKAGASEEENKPKSAIGEYLLLPSGEGTFVLACIDGGLIWLEAEECEEEQ